MAFQYPVEIPGVSNQFFLQTALNAVRNYRGQEALDRFDFQDVLEIETIQRLLATIVAHGIQRSLQEKLVADAGDLYRILEGHKDTFPLGERWLLRR